MLTLTVPIVLAIGIAAYAVHLFQSRSKAAPGPVGLPFIGNWLDFPKAGEEPMKWMKLREKYGDLISMTMPGGLNILAVNSYQKAYEMLEEKAEIYSDRKPEPMAGDLMGWKGNMAFLPYNSDFREGRKLFGQEFGSATTIEKFREQQEIESVYLLQNLLKKPHEWSDITLKSVSSMIMRITYGYEHQDEDIELVILMHKCMADAAYACARSSFLVNTFPILAKIPSWIPGAGFKTQAKEWSAEREEMHEVPFDFVLSKMESGTATDSFASRLIRRHQNNPEQLKKIEWLAGSIFIGASDNIFSTMEAFFMAMALYPEAQAHAQAEIDDVVGHGWLPRFQDRKDMPYCNALVKEVYRFFTVSPIAMPHRSTSDDVHDNAFIAKGTLVYPNVWLMAHDNEVYTNPYSFDPTRFMGPMPQQDPMDYAFGFGKRVCPGKALTDSVVWLNVVRILAMFQISRSDDITTGQRHRRPIKGTPGLTSHPVFDFDIEIEARSAKTASLIKASMASVY